MSNVTVVTNHVWSRFKVTSRAGIAISAFGLAALFGQAHVAEAALPAHPCTSELNQLLAEWNEAGFVAPSKPSQAIVHGRNGRISSGPEVTSLAGQIRQAIADCQRGDVQSVQQVVALVSKRLHQQS